MSAKKTWSVNGAVVGGRHIGNFEATTGAEAIAAARNSGECYVSLCHHCANQCSDPDIENLSATCGDEEVMEDEPDGKDWQSLAIAAGWTPPIDAPTGARVKLTKPQMILLGAIVAAGDAGIVVDGKNGTTAMVLRKHDLAVYVPQSRGPQRHKATEAGRAMCFQI